MGAQAAVVEIRSYRLKPGSGAAFHRLVVEQSMPMLERWGVDVIAFGPSLDGDDLYVLVRGSRASPSCSEARTPSTEATSGATGPARRSWLSSRATSRS